MTSVMSSKATKLAVTDKNRAPLYHQIFLILQGRIYDGEFGAGSMLPGENEIAATYGVSRITANRAMNELAAAGLVVREKGRGTIVRPSIQGKISRGPAEFTVERAQDGIGGRIKLLSFEYQAAAADIAAHLGLRAGAEIQRAVRMWHIRSKPYNHLTTYIDAEIGRLWTRSEMRKRPLNVLLRSNGFHVERIDESVTATLADLQLADDLGVSVGGALLKIIRTSYDAGDRPLEHLIAFYPPDRYQYRASLGRHELERNHVG